MLKRVPPQETGLSEKLHVISFDLFNYITETIDTAITVIGIVLKTRIDFELQISNHCYYYG